jgi:hypothetical protein
MNIFAQVTPQPETQTRLASLSLIGQSIQKYLLNMGKQAIAFFTQAHEPKITHHIHADGTSTWRIYDPESGQSTVCHSVAEVRKWLESRYSFRGLY